MKKGDVYLASVQYNLPQPIDIPFCVMNENKRYLTGFFPNSETISLAIIKLEKSKFIIAPSKKLLLAAVIDYCKGSIINRKNEIHLLQSSIISFRKQLSKEK